MKREREPMRSQAELAQRLLKKPAECPQCGSDVLDASAYEEELGHLRCQVECVCGLKWREIFKLVSGENFVREEDDDE